jgi:hypothetical protein
MPSSKQFPSPNVLLTGGTSANVPEEQRLRFAADPTDTVKVFMGNRFEHFVPTGEVRQVGGQEVHVLEWSRRTYVAE